MVNFDLNEETIKILKGYSDKELKRCTTGKWFDKGKLFIRKDGLPKLRVFKIRYVNYIDASIELKDICTGISILQPLSNVQLCPYKQLKSYLNGINLSSHLSLTESYFSKMSDLSWRLLIHKECSKVFPDNELTIDADCFAIVCSLGDVEITNSAEFKHVMKEVYVKFIFNSREKRFHKMEMLRTRVTRAEKDTDYLFSHINTNYVGVWSSYFCMGDTQLYKLYSGIKDKINYYDIPLFFSMINEYFRWESLEGTPYRYISNIEEKKRGYLAPSQDWEKVKVGIENIILPIIPQLTYNILESENVFSLTLTSESKELIDQTLTQAFPNYCYVRIDNNSYEDVHNIPEHLEGYFTYKNNKIPCVIEASVNNITEKKINTCILNSIISSIEQNLSNVFNNIKDQELCQQ